MDKIKRARTRIALFAYAYEIKHNSLVSDAQYDKEANELDYKSRTDDNLLDYFFMTQYKPYTGIWVHQHPDIETGKLEALYEYVSRNIKANSRAH